MRGGYVLHIGVVEGSFKVGDKVNQQIDEVNGVCCGVAGCVVV